MKKKSIILILLIILIVSLIFPKSIFAEINYKENNSENIQEKKDIFENIEASNLLLAETSTGKIIYERKVNEKIYPASLTKLMTAIIVVENCELDEIVIVSENAVNSVPSGYVNSNLQVGEELTVEDLLYVMLIPSANDAANALAEHVGGNIESFSAMMNSRAKELGCIGSNFTNPSGLHEEEHYSTTKDLFLISNKAMSYELIQKILKTTIYTLPSTNKYSGEERVFGTTNYMIKKNLTKFYCDYCIGAKTGYTDKAGNCVVEFAKKDDIELTAIVMGVSSKIKGEKFLNAKKMFEYVFKNYESYKVVKKNEKHETIKVSNGTKETRELDVIYKDDINILIQKNNKKNVEKNIEYTNLKAPIQNGTIVGKITCKYEEIEYSTQLIANGDVEESKILSNLLKILLLALVLYIIYNFKKSNRKYGNHGKNNKKKLRRKI